MPRTPAEKAREMARRARRRAERHNAQDNPDVPHRFAANLTNRHYCACGRHEAHKLHHVKT